MPTVYEGTFGFASLTLSIKVECSKFHYYPNCAEDGCQSQGNCTCFPGYTGPRCESKINQCAENTCPENAICVEQLNSFSCLPLNNSNVTDTDDCAGVNCSGNGKCMEDANNFKCLCSQGYTGELCEKPPSRNDGKQKKEVIDITAS